MMRATEAAPSYARPVGARPDSPGLWEQLFVVVVVVLSTNGPIQLLENALKGAKHPFASGEANPTTLGLWLVIYVVALALGMRRRDSFIATALRDRAVLAMVGLTVLSTFWSQEPVVTLKRAPALLGTCIVGWYIASRFSPRDIAHLLARAFGAIAILSTAFSLLFPFGTSQEEESTGLAESYVGAWNGIYTTKNVLGQVMALAVVVLLLVAVDARRRRLVPLLGAAGAAALVVLSRSATSLILAVAFAACVPALVLLVRRHAYVVSATAAAVVPVVGGAVAYCLTDPGALFAALGRDATFTGRTPLWGAVLTQIGERPWLGYGHGAFWVGLQSPGHNYIVNATGWAASYAHNGFLDQWLSTGAVGVACLVWILLTTAWRGLARARHSGSVLDAWPMVLVAFLVASNLTEGGLVQQNYYMWLLLVAASASARAGTAATAARPATALPDIRLSPARPQWG